MFFRSFRGLLRRIPCFVLGGLGWMDGLELEGGMGVQWTLYTQHRFLYLLWFSTHQDTVGTQHNNTAQRTQTRNLKTGMPDSLRLTSYTSRDRASTSIALHHISLPLLPHPVRIREPKAAPSPSQTSCGTAHWRWRSPAMGLCGGNTRRSLLSPFAPATSHTIPILHPPRYPPQTIPFHSFVCTASRTCTPPPTHTHPCPLTSSLSLFFILDLPPLVTRLFTLFALFISRFSFPSCQVSVLQY